MGAPELERGLTMCLRSSKWLENEGHERAHHISILPSNVSPHPFVHHARPQPLEKHSRGGGVLSPKSYVDVPAGPRKSDCLYTNFLPNFPPISIPFSKEKHPILIKLGAFYNNLPKIHPIFNLNLGSFVSDENPPDRYTKFREKVPQKAGTYTYIMSM